MSQSSLLWSIVQIRVQNNLDFDFQCLPVTTPDAKFNTAVNLMVLCPGPTHYYYYTSDAPSDHLGGFDKNTHTHVFKYNHLPITLPFKFPFKFTRKSNM